ncbi:unnamed protein product [Calypogeia fissa]
MSQPRVTITFGRNGQGQRRATVSRDMYSDQINGAGAGGNRKRSVRERLGGAQEQTSPAVVRLPKRTRLDEGKWKHDLYDEQEEITIRQPSGQDLQSDLRSRLGRRNVTRGQGEVSSTGGMKDLREKLSGPIQAPQVNRDTALQRRLQSVVRGSSGIASLATGRPGISRNSAIAPKAPMLQRAPIHKAQPVEIDENSIAGFFAVFGFEQVLNNIPSRRGRHGCVKSHG